MVDGTGLENRHTRKGIGGSNPSLSARPLESACCRSATFGALLIRCGNTTALKCCSTTDISKIKFLQNTGHVSSTAASVFVFSAGEVACIVQRNGRPSIDPESAVCGSCCWYLCGISSERRLLEEPRMHSSWRWFTVASPTRSCETDTPVRCR